MRFKSNSHCNDASQRSSAELVPAVKDHAITPPPHLDILYQDEDIVVVDKPAGMLVHRSEIDRHETVFLLQTLRDQIGKHVYPVHRLDKPTSGVMVLALNKNSAIQLTQSFTERKIQKEYLAVVRGIPAIANNAFANDAGTMATINYPLSEQLDKFADKKAIQQLNRHNNDGCSNAEKSVQKPAQLAVTDYCVVNHCELPVSVSPRYPTSRYALLKLHPKTGRKHQIRRHMKHIFHPIIGDTTYGEGRHNRFFRQQFDCSRLLLMASELTLPHPTTQKTMSFSVAPSGSFANVLQQLNWQI